MFRDFSRVGTSGEAAVVSILLSMLVLVQVAVILWLLDDWLRRSGLIHFRSAASESAPRFRRTPALLLNEKSVGAPAENFAATAGRALQRATAMRWRSRV